MRAIRNHWFIEFFLYFREFFPVRSHIIWFISDLKFDDERVSNVWPKSKLSHRQFSQCVCVWLLFSHPSQIIHLEFNYQRFRHSLFSIHINTSLNSLFEMQIEHSISCLLPLLLFMTISNTLKNYESCFWWWKEIVSNESIIQHTYDSCVCLLFDHSILHKWVAARADRPMN